MRNILHVTLVVREYDEAIEFFTRKLGFEVREDTDLGGGKRWVVVGPRDSSGTTLLLAKAANLEQIQHIGNQTGGRVAFFLQTDDFAYEYQRMKTAGVRFVENPRTEPYGTVVVFEDLYGNRWDLLQLK